MIVRINQIDVNSAESETRWAAEGLLGPPDTAWPGAPQAFELLILEQDEQKQALHETFRQGQMRLMIPQAIAAMREPGEEIVLRLDGPLAAGELLGAIARLTETDQTGRYALSPARKFDLSPQEVIGSIRVQPSPQACSEICMDPAIGLHRSVRLRAYAVPESLVNPLLDIDDPQDERWREIVPRLGFMLSTSRELRSLQIITSRLGAQEVKTRIMQRLLESAKAPNRAAG